jgi:hypothetical protein
MNHQKTPYATWSHQNNHERQLSSPDNSPVKLSNAPQNSPVTPELNSTTSPPNHYSYNNQNSPGTYPDSYQYTNQASYQNPPGEYTQGYQHASPTSPTQNYYVPSTNNNSYNKNDVISPGYNSQESYQFSAGIQSPRYPDERPVVPMSRHSPIPQIPTSPPSAQPKYPIEETTYTNSENVSGKYPLSKIPSSSSPIPPELPHTYNPTSLTHNTPALPPIRGTSPLPAIIKSATVEPPPKKSNDADEISRKSSGASVQSVAIDSGIFTVQVPVSASVYADAEFDGKGKHGEEFTHLKYILKFLYSCNVFFINFEKKIDTQQ